MRKRTKTFRSKLYSAFIVSIIVPSVLTGILFLTFYGRTLVKQGTKNMNSILKSVGNNMEAELSELKNAGNVCYMHQDALSIVELLHAANQDAAHVVYFPMNEEDGRAYYMEQGRPGIQMIEAKEVHKEEWYRQALEADGRGILYANHRMQYGTKETEEVYSCVRAIKSKDSGEYIGVIKVDMDVKNLQKIVDIIDTEERDNIIISRENRVLASSKKIAYLKEKDFEDGIQLIDGNLYDVKTTKIQECDWELTYLLSLWPSIRYHLHVFLITFAVIGIIVPAAFFIYKKYSEETVDDMEHITDVFRQVQNGNLDVAIHVKSGNELYDIAVIANQMIENLKKYIDKEYLWVIRQQKAQYKVLQAQINPHFLYNTFNGLIALNRMGEKKNLEKSIMNLSNLFRYSSSKDDFTTIEKECSFVKEYLELEKLKYEERVEYEIFFDDASKEKKIPKLLLQPIVENSIVHGMGETDVPIKINVVVSAAGVKGIGNVTMIMVSDDGIGFDKDGLSDGEEHSGVENVKSRAELFCREMAFQCISKPGRGTKTIFIFRED